MCGHPDEPYGVSQHVEQVVGSICRIVVVRRMEAAWKCWGPCSIAGKEVLPGQEDGHDTIAGYLLKL